MERLQRYRYPLLFVALAALFNLPFLSGVHLFDWDELTFSEIAREMVVLGDYLRIHMYFRPFYEKPPFFFWLQALSMEAFGVGEFAARLPNALAGMVTLPLLYSMGRRLYDERFGLLWAGAYGGSLLPAFYFTSAIIDPWFNLWIFLGLYFLILFYWKKDGYQYINLSRSRWTYLLLAGVWCGLGILTKGPVAYLVIALVLGVYWIGEWFRFYINVGEFLLYTLATAATTFVWYGVETLLHGPEFITEFIIRQYTIFSTADAGHAGFPGYHFVVNFFGCFPASIFALRAFRRTTQAHAYQTDFKRWMLIMLWVVLVLFTIVRSKIVHYSSLIYFPVTYLAALTLYQMIDGEISFKRWMRITLIAVVGVLAVGVIALPFIGLNPGWIAPLAKDPVAKAALLEAQPGWQGWEGIAGVFFFGTVLLAAHWMSHKNWTRGIATLFLSTAITLKLVLSLYIAKIETYSQGAVVDFFTARQAEDCYVMTLFHKSYIPHFYARTQPETAPEHYMHPSNLVQLYETRPQSAGREITQWLLKGPIDKPLYLAVKVSKTERMAPYLPELEELYRKNGFVFYKRTPPNVSAQ